MRRLKIPRYIFEEMLAHCRGACPNEACGILSGRGDEVLAIYTMSNREKSPVSYLMDPGEQFKAMKDIREKGLSMVGIFHSHPSSAAYPSPRDVSLAFYEDAVYVIVGLAGADPEVKAFSIREGEIKNVRLAVKGER